jgi:hypothetical protein
MISGSASPTVADSPGNPMSPPPSYHDIPGTVPAHQGASRGPPPSYEEAVDPNGTEKECWGSVFWYGSGCADPDPRIRTSVIADPEPEHCLKSHKEVIKQ